MPARRQKLRARLYRAVMELPAMVVTELAREAGYDDPLWTQADLERAGEWLWERALVEDSVLDDLSLETEKP